MDAVPEAVKEKTTPVTQSQLVELVRVGIRNGQGAAVVEAVELWTSSACAEIVRLREQRADLLAALESCDVVMDTAALHGVGCILPQIYRDSWVRAHEAARTATDKVRG